MAAQGMTLRNMHLVGGTQRRVEVPAAHRAAFEEGCALIFTRWTALQLGVQNEWGGSHSRQKAGDLLRDTINWFYNTKGAWVGGGGGGRGSGRAAGGGGQRPWLRFR